MIKKWLPIGALSAAALLMSSSALAEFPTQPERIVVGYSAGGTTDILARVLGERLAQVLGVPVIVENKSGAAGSIAAAYVQHANPDGTTLLMATVSSHGLNPSVYKKDLGYSAENGFTPVAKINEIPLVLITKKGSPYTSVKELVNAAKKAPGHLNYSSSGNGSPVHIAGAMFAKAAGLDITHVPYRGGAQANSAILSGEAQLSFATLPAAIPFIRSGDFLALAVTTAKRAPQLPDVPALGELPGFEGYEINTWNALLAPAKTPPAVVEKLNVAINEALKSPKVIESFESQGAAPKPSTAAELDTFIKGELQKWKKVIASLEISIK